MYDNIYKDYKINSDTVYFSYFNNDIVYDLDLIRYSVALKVYGRKCRVASEFLVSNQLFTQRKLGALDYDTFLNQYQALILNRLNPHKMYEKYKGTVLLCHEIDECHRFQIKSWLESYGYPCIELPNQYQLKEGISYT